MNKIQLPYNETSKLEGIIQFSKSRILISDNPYNELDLKFNFYIERFI